MTTGGASLPVVSRTQRSVANAAAGLLAQGVVVLLGFVTRTVFVQQLGVGLLGIQTLLLSVLSLATLADLGMGTAIMYALYEPLRAGDADRVSAIVRYAGRLYRRVALGTALIGLLVLPFLHSLVSLDRPVEHLELYYLVMLASSVLNFLMYDRTILLEADQRAYWTRIASVLFNTLRSGLQIVALVVWQNFLLFLIIQALSTVLNNLVVFGYVGRAYPQIRHGPRLEDRSRHEIARSVRAMLIYRVSGLALNNTDPIIISTIVGTLALGLYSNYMLIVGSIVMMIEVMFQAVTPSVGHLVASGDHLAMRRVFDEIQLLAIVIYGTAAVVLALTLNEGVQVWLGVKFTLSPMVLLAIILNFYLLGSTAPILAFRVAAGVFHEVKYVLAISAVLNIALSIVMGRLFGLQGVLFATAAARLMTTVWYEPTILFRRHIQGGARYYISRHLTALVALIASFLGISFAVSVIQAPLFIILLVKVLLGLSVAPASLWWLFRTTETRKTLAARISHLRANKTFP